MTRNVGTCHSQGDNDLTLNSHYHALSPHLTSHCRALSGHCCSTSNDGTRTHYLVPAPVLHALLRCELLQCPAFPFSALSSQLLTLRHQSASTPVVYTGKNIHLNLNFHLNHLNFSIACTCGAIFGEMLSTATR